MCRIAAIGPATAGSLKSRGLVAEYTPKAFTAADILKGLLDQGVSGQRILMPGAEEHGSILPDGLRRGGAELDEVSAYVNKPETGDTGEILKLLDAGRIQAVSFASSSSVRHFLRRLPPEILSRYPDLRYACIGPVTAKTLTDAGLTCHIMPKEHTIPALVEAIAKGL
jgi:uroporphyrinogen III methyltransferase/synthase